MSFRQNLIKYYRSCLITGIHAAECDGAHIIPVDICEDFITTARTGHDWSTIKNNPDNGLLLCKNLHWSFDGFFWTFDIFDCKIRQTSGQTNYYLPIIISNPLLKSTIKNYQNDFWGQPKYYQVRSQSLPYLFIHYHVFLLLNGRKGNTASRQSLHNLTAYQTAISNLDLDLDSFLARLTETKTLNSKIIEDNFIFSSAKNLISKSKPILSGLWDYSSFNDKFLALYWGQRWKDRRWVDRKELPSEACDLFKEYLDDLEDPGYEYPGFIKRRKIK